MDRYLERLTITFCCIGEKNGADGTHPAAEPTRRGTVRLRPAAAGTALPAAARPRRRLRRPLERHR